MSKLKSNNKYKITFALIVLILVAITVYNYSSNFSSKNKRSSQILEYKKDLYKSLVCEYNCPLSMQQYQNKTQLIPSISCIKNCTKDFKAKWGDLNASKEELSKDNLIKDLSNTIEDCKTQGNQTLVNNTVFFSCTTEGLDLIKEKYSYLR